MSSVKGKEDHTFIANAGASNCPVLRPDEAAVGTTLLRGSQTEIVLPKASITVLRGKISGSGKTPTENSAGC
jgi:hypothetical protein